MSDVSLPQPEEISAIERDDAMGAYLMMFAAWGIGLPLPILNLVAALIYHYVNRRRSRFVAFNSLQSLTSQIPVTLCNVVMVVWAVRNIVLERAFLDPFWTALIVVAVLNAGYVVFSIIGLVNARRGQIFYFPIFGRIAFERFFGPEAIDLTPKVRPNRPPTGYEEQ